MKFRVLKATDLDEALAWGARPPSPVGRRSRCVRFTDGGPIDPHYWQDQPLTLVLWDDLRIERLHQRGRHAVRADWSGRLSAFCSA